MTCENRRRRGVHVCRHRDFFCLSVCLTPSVGLVLCVYRVNDRRQELSSKECII